MNFKIVLASNSPRRKQLLALTGWPFVVRPVNIDESTAGGEAPDDYVRRLAERKALAAGSLADPGEIILAADTTVADGSRILGKPADAGEAREMLRSLRGREHSVYTAIGVYNPLTEQMIVDLCATQVWMRSYTDRELEDYIASGDPFDKAGAYAIQNPQFQPVERIQGCYACVVGLPVCHVVRAMAAFGISPDGNLPGGCPEHLESNTPCPIYEKMIREEFGGDGL